MTLHPLESTYAEAADNFDRHRRANGMPSVDDLQALYDLTFAVAVRNGVCDFSRNLNDEWVANCHLRIDNTTVHVQASGTTLEDCAKKARTVLQDKIRAQGTGFYD
jgi:hypothetical protein